MLAARLLKKALAHVRKKHAETSSKMTITCPRRDHKSGQQKEPRLRPEAAPTSNKGKQENRDCEGWALCRMLAIEADWWLIS